MVRSPYQKTVNKDFTGKPRSSLRPRLWSSVFYFDQEKEILAFSQLVKFFGVIVIPEVMESAAIFLLARSIGNPPSFSLEPPIKWDKRTSIVGLIQEPSLIELIYSYSLDAVTNFDKHIPPMLEP
jgi:hypothetical protein